MRKTSILAMLTVVLGSCLAFRDTLWSGLDHVSGDWEDGMLIIGITEHWYQWLMGRASWNTLPMFFPEPGNLGYSDTFFLFGGIHSLLRIFGLDVFAAFSITLMAVCVLGLWGMWLLLGKMPRLPLTVRVWGVLLFALISPINSSISNSHLQFTAAWLSPWFFFIGWQLLVVEREKKILWAGILGGALGVLTFSTFYTAWYLIFFCCLCVLWVGLLLLVRPVKRHEADGGKLIGLAFYANKFRKELQGFVFAQRKVLIFFGGVFGLLLIPFGLVYIPVLQDLDKSTFGSLLSLVDFINTGEHNLLWGWLHESLRLHERHLYWELRLGFPPLTMALFATAAIWVVRSRKVASLTAPEPCSNEERLWWKILPILLLGIAAAWFLMLKIAGSGFWVLVHELVPGASVIRVVSRFNTMLSLPLVVVLVFAIGSWWRSMVCKAGGRLNYGRMVGFILLMGLLLAEQIRHGYDKPMLRRDKALALFEAIEPMPPGSEVFALAPGDLIEIPGTFSGPVRDQMIALHLAQRNGLKTLNGYSGRLPKAWYLSDLRDPSYTANLRGWMLRKNVPSTALLDLTDFSWSRFEVPPVVSWTPPEKTSETARQWPENIFLYGFSPVEPWGIWSTGREAALRFNIPAEVGKKPRLRLTLGAFINTSLEQQRVHLKEAGGFEKDLLFTLQNPEHTIEIPLLKADGDTVIPVDVQFYNHDLAKPWKHGLPNESRRLGVSLTRIEIITHP
jgi:hypothetical protein